MTRVAAELSEDRPTFVPRPPPLRGNSARSIFGEYFLRRLGGSRFAAVCADARETCPIFPGQPIVAHRGVDNPATFVGTPDAQFRFFHQVALTLYTQLQIFTSLPLEQLDRLKLEMLTRDIGRAQAPPTELVRVTARASKPSR